MTFLPGRSSAQGRSVIAFKPATSVRLKMPLASGLDADREEVQQQGGGGAGLLGLRAQSHGRLPRQFRPVAAGQVGERQQRLPDVRRPVIQPLRQLGPGGGNLLRVVQHKAQALAPQRDGVELQEPGGFFALKSRTPLLRPHPRG